MQINLEHLKTKESHPLRKQLDRFPRSRISETLGISTNYLCDVLTGHARPSAALEGRMYELVKAIAEAEAEDR